MGYAKKPVNLSLNADLVTEVRAFTPNLSETVERLLSEFVAQKRAAEAAHRRDIDEAIAFATDAYERYGLIGAEFLPE